MVPVTQQPSRAVERSRSKVNLMHRKILHAMMEPKGSHSSLILQMRKMSPKAEERFSRVTHDLAVN